MEAIIGLIELAVGMILFFLASLMFARISGYGEFYDKMLYNQGLDKYKTNKRNNNNNNDVDFIHRISIKKTNSKWKQNY
jgi:hypothetical protein